VVGASRANEGLGGTPPGWFAQSTRCSYPARRELSGHRFRQGLVVDDVVLRGFSDNAGEVGGLDAACTTNALVSEAIEE
jgi:hypothetical protein